MLMVAPAPLVNALRRHRPAPALGHGLMGFTSTSPFREQQP